MWATAASATLITHELDGTAGQPPVTNLYYPGAGHGYFGLPPYYPLFTELELGSSVQISTISVSHRSASYALRGCSLCTETLKGLGIPAAIGAVPGEYCPGDCSVNVLGCQKVVGTAQRVLRNAWLFSTLIVLGDENRLQPVLRDLYEMLDLPFDECSVGSVGADCMARCGAGATMGSPDRGGKQVDRQGLWSNAGCPLLAWARRPGLSGWPPADPAFFACWPDLAMLCSDICPGSRQGGPGDDH